ncbi:hypothetical protein KO481_42070 [Nocardia sp. NEAU-G5]|uniref:ESX-1 secretion-associated protein n=1 Tax=Nocardia albiluteola TaxID=2842303 RepID=A0ABS6BCR9_9NOCA|nr:hypothetical protein [Nocardia albiluteola]MBU3068091.1 hypothetical protein [Nocardia albiluteola]
MSNPFSLSPLASGASGMDASSLLNLFSEALQLLSSGIPMLQQLGMQLASSLGPGLQSLASAVQNGVMTVKQAMADATAHVGTELDQFRHQFDHGPSGPKILDLDLSLTPRAGVANWGPQGYLPGVVPNLTIDTGGPAVVDDQPAASGVTAQGEQ